MQKSFFSNVECLTGINKKNDNYQPLWLLG